MTASQTRKMFFLQQNSSVIGTVICIVAGMALFHNVGILETTKIPMATRAVNLLNNLMLLASSFMLVIMGFKVRVSSGTVGMVHYSDCR